jgi:hypothetical protein
VIAELLALRDDARSTVDRALPWQFSSSAILGTLTLRRIEGGIVLPSPERIRRASQIAPFTPLRRDSKAGLALTIVTERGSTCDRRAVVRPAGFEPATVGSEDRSSSN